MQRRRGGYSGRPGDGNCLTSRLHRTATRDDRFYGGARHFAVMAVRVRAYLASQTDLENPHFAEKAARTLRFLLTLKAHSLSRKADFSARQIVR